MNFFFSTVLCLSNRKIVNALKTKFAIAADIRGIKFYGIMRSAKSSLVNKSSIVSKWRVWDIKKKFIKINYRLRLFSAIVLDICALGD
jgi:hypothetical protein